MLMDDHTDIPTPEETAAAATPETPPVEAGAPATDPRDTEIAALKERLLRLQADFDNFRKRTLRDREDHARRACERMLEHFLPVLDHFDLGLKAAQKHHVKHAVIDGLSNVLKQFEQALEKAGVLPIDTVGKVFDPHLHECVAHLPSEEHPERVIIQETRRGYRLGNYLLRAAQVIVSTGPAGSEAKADPQSKDTPGTEPA